MHRSHQIHSKPILKINEADEFENHIYILCIVLNICQTGFTNDHFLYISVLYCVQLLWSQGCIDGPLWNFDTFDTRTLLIIIMSNSN